MDLDKKIVRGTLLSLNLATWSGIVYLLFIGLYWVFSGTAFDSYTSVRDAEFLGKTIIHKEHFSQNRDGSKGQMNPNNRHGYARAVGKRKIVEALDRSTDFSNVVDLQSYFQRFPELLVDIPSRTPLERGYYRVSSVFGKRLHPFHQRVKPHRGYDFAAPKGTTVFATASGVVESVLYEKWYGNYLVLAHEYGYSTLYGHLDTVLVQVGTYVVQGTPVARVGATGRVTGSHVHYEIRKDGEGIDPSGFLGLQSRVYRSLVEALE